ncbi:type I-D CRISPR-associated helicase Cas3' (plasmid) [Leptolyngbya sp. BL0902]|uniref:type I-D CRISPR-associated helicase Cas3' n=1 Tax=Leptolyngbya sp. BL0902 TaxID=1115757 RepID=UPI0018E6EE8B|nr:type I-D CRISPR-associated helicase Cas3' [Leptolyngbya sp. BL0902]QQE67647.1 type I-D CRISPR-associated helicase Cas3' [Leptolyngbya sp. BL0902]
MDSLKIHLEPRSIATCPNPDLPPELLNVFGKDVLQHQYEVYEAAKTHDIILDLAPTGTGKTKAGLSVIHHNSERNAIYIAPTNALIEQQAEAAEKFVKATGLPHVVKAASARHVKQWSDERVGNRSGEKLYNVLREPATVFPECAGRPILLVTNPDIFYYATFFAYNRLDHSNIASAFYSSFATVIFDEFHLYDSKQLVSLLFYLALSHSFGYFRDNRKVVLLTATPEAACEAALIKLEEAGAKIYHVDGETQTDRVIPSQTAVSLEIRKQLEKKKLISEIANEVLMRVKENPNQFGAVILDSLDQVDQLNDCLCNAGIENLRGRITGAIKSKSERHEAAQKQIILATSTVDVGFNFERDAESERQNLDWLIFSTRDRFSFWQRIGRVGRVLGKKQTDVPSEVIAYLPEKAWEEGIENLDRTGGREALKQTLENLICMKRQFLEIYWKSEAFLEIARPLLELESALHNLEEEKLVQDLYTTLQKIFGGSRSWNYYKQRMMQIITAEALAKAPIKPKKEGQWSFIKILFKQSPYIRQSFIRKFLEFNYPEQLEALSRQEFSMEELEKEFKDYEETAVELKEFAIFWKTVWSPLFRFRDSLFDSLTIYDPHNFLLDKIGETDLDPFHLLRFYEFISDNLRIEIYSRAEETYQLSFTLNVETLSHFEATQLGKLWAYPNLSVRRTSGGAVRPTKLPVPLEKILRDSLIPGVIVKEHGQAKWAIIKLKRQGLDCYPIHVSSHDSPSSKEYLFFPSLSGILALAAAGVALQSPDNEEFWVA